MRKRNKMFRKIICKIIGHDFDLMSAQFAKSDFRDNPYELCPLFVRKTVCSRCGFIKTKTYYHELINFKKG